MIDDFHSTDVISFASFNADSVINHLGIKPEEDVAAMCVRALYDLIYEESGECCSSTVGLAALRKEAVGVAIGILEPKYHSFVQYADDFLEKESDRDAVMVAVMLIADLCSIEKCESTVLNKDLMDRAISLVDGYGAKLSHDAWFVQHAYRFEDINRYIHEFDKSSEGELRHIWGVEIPEILDIVNMNSLIGRDLHDGAIKFRSRIEKKLNIDLSSKPYYLRPWEL